MIPQFPKFKKLQLSDKKDIEKITRNHRPYSDYNVCSLWNYNVEDDLEISLLNNNLVVKFRDYITNEELYSFIGNNKVINTAQRIIDIAKDKNIQTSLKLIPEHVVKADKRLHEIFDVIEDPDNHDYVLHLGNLAQLKGKKFASKRKNARKFMKNNSDIIVQKLDLSSEQVHKMILNTFDTWAKLKKLPKEETDHERIALQRFLDSLDHIKPFGLGIWDSTRNIAFSLVELDKNGYSHNHFFKTHPSYHGLYEVLDSETARHLLDRGYSFMNIQQDLGITGLRMAKKLCRPDHYLKKFIIKEKKN